MSTRKDAWQGMNWIRQESRLALYLRDGLACAYCGASVECGARLTLDHLVPVSKGGHNRATNLITACETCNYSRKDRELSAFVGAAAAFHGKATAAEISADIARLTGTPAAELAGLRAQAREMIARRGSCAKAIYQD